MNRPLFLFVDESGDAGDNDGTGSNTIYYAELAIQTEYGRLSPLIRHITKWRYEEGIFNEPKHIPKDEGKCKDFLEPIIGLNQTGVIQFSAVYLRKDKYTGPYLKTSPPKWNNRLISLGTLFTSNYLNIISTYTPKRKMIISRPSLIITECRGWISRMLLIIYVIFANSD